MSERIHLPEDIVLADILEGYVEEYYSTVNRLIEMVNNRNYVDRLNLVLQKMKKGYESNKLYINTDHLDYVSNIITEHKLGNIIKENGLLGKAYFITSLSCLINEYYLSASNYALKSLLHSNTMPKDFYLLVPVVEKNILDPSYESNSITAFRRIKEKFGAAFTMMFSDEFKNELLTRSGNNDKLKQIYTILGETLVTKSDNRLEMEYDIESILMNLGKYEGKIEYLGKGNFSRVYKVRLAGAETTGGVHNLHGRSHTGKFVAVKVIYLSPEARNVFTNEIAVWANLSRGNNVCRNIAKMNGFWILGKNNEFGVIEMEFLSNGTLKDFIRELGENRLLDMKSGHKDEYEETTILVSFFLEILNGVKFAHDLNIYHRDIKSENIMFDDNMIPKIVDWGIGNIQGIHNQQYYTALINTPPEINWLLNVPLSDEDNQIASQSLDIYQLGVLFYYILSRGKDPYNIMKEDYMAKGKELFSILFERQIRRGVDFSFLEGHKDAEILINVINRMIEPNTLIFKVTKDDVGFCRYSNVNDILNDLNIFIQRETEDIFEKQTKSSNEELISLTQQRGINLKPGQIENPTSNIQTHDRILVDILVGMYITKIKEDYLGKLISSRGTWSLSITRGLIELEKKHLDQILFVYKDKRIKQIISILRDVDRLVYNYINNNYIKIDYEVSVISKKLDEVNMGVID